MRMTIPRVLLLGLLGLARPASAECLDYDARLHWAGRALVGGAIEDVATDAQHAYVAVTAVGLKVLDLADPDFPSYRATLERAAAAGASSRTGRACTCCPRRARRAWT
ncbi:MAG: hypothetical protein IPH09_07235 [bacterium]|nr:hypothetical protein [bacterium]